MKDVFRFRKFVIKQDRCAMKVGTDGVLLGAWANGGRKILDIGTGTGLIALMMAQRFPDAEITAIDIDEDAIMQATDNVSNTSFKNNITLINKSLTDFVADETLTQSYDSIVSNPPFFDNSLKCPNQQRSVARHTDTLPFSELLEKASRLLAKDGLFSIIIPTVSKNRILEQAKLDGLYASRITNIKTTERKEAKRTLIEFTHHNTPLYTEEPLLMEELIHTKEPTHTEELSYTKRPTHTKESTLTEEQTLTKEQSLTKELILMEGGQRSSWFQELTKDFYL